MKINGLLLMLSCAAVLAGPAGAQTDSSVEPGQKGHSLSPALQKKVAERAAALRAHAAEAVGPLFDTVSKDWTIDAAACPLVKSQVKLTGFKGHTVWATMNNDGSFHLQIRTEASGTAVDASGNKYIWIYAALANLETPDPTADQPLVTGYSPVTFQLIPLTTNGAGYTAAGYVQADTPTPLNSPFPVTANAPLACAPI
jgi:hypothetical protein